MVTTNPTNTLNIYTAADRLGVSPNFLNRHLYDGTIPSPDGYSGRGHSPWWHTATIEAVR